MSDVSGEPDGRSNAPGSQARPIEIRVAMVALIAALAGAVLGAVVGGLFSVATTAAQIEAESRRQEATFLREQRQEAYREYLVIKANLLDIELNLYTLLNDPTRMLPPTDEFNTLLDRLSATSSELSQSEILLQLIASTEAAAAIRESGALHSEAAVACQEAGGALLTQSSDTGPKLDAARATINRALFDDAPGAAFLVAARADLASDPPE